MLLDEFKSKIMAVGRDDSSQWRAQYIRTFVDESSQFYKKNILALKQYSDGMYYEGYLWDCIKGIRVISFEELCTRLRGMNRSVKVMWDLHSSDKIRIPNYWKFGKDAVLIVNSRDLCDGIEHLPEDIYIFDDGMSWTYVTTHEYRADNTRVCGIVENFDQSAPMSQL